MGTLLCPEAILLLSQNLSIRKIEDLNTELAMSTERIEDLRTKLAMSTEREGVNAGRDW